MEKTKEQRTKQEKTRLNRQFGRIDRKKKAVAAGLIERAAFMRVELEDMELDIAEHGFVEMFSQGDQEPYERLRPMANAYNSMNGNYQKIIRQLTALLPKETANPREDGDGFEEFITVRED